MSTKTYRRSRRRRRTPEERAAMESEALERARSGESFGNFPAIFAGLMAKGIPEADIHPRENVFGYHAWRALGRQVRRGEHGVSVVTFVTRDVSKRCPGRSECRACREGVPDSCAFRRCATTATVFHITQTDPREDQNRAA